MIGRLVDLRADVGAAADSHFLTSQPNHRVDFVHQRLHACLAIESSRVRKLDHDPRSCSIIAEKDIGKTASQCGVTQA